MAKKKFSLRDYKLVCRSSSPLLKGAVILAIALSTVALLSLQHTIRTAKEESQALRRQAVVLEQEKKNLKEDIAQVGTVEGVKKIASSELGLADPNTTFYRPGK